MAFYDSLFASLGLQDWCGDGAKGGPMTMAELLAKSKSNTAAEETTLWNLPFPSLDNLHAACKAIPRTRDMTSGVEEFFLSIKSSLQFVLDPLTQPLSWLLDGSIWLYLAVRGYALVVVNRLDLGWCAINHSLKRRNLVSGCYLVVFSLY